MKIVTLYEIDDKKILKWKYNGKEYSTLILEEDPRLFNIFTDINKELKIFDNIREEIDSETEWLDDGDDWDK